MGKLDSPFGITGTFTKLSFYRMKGHDQIIIRHGKGPSRKQIMYSPKMKRTRNHIAEFTARNMVAKIINSRLPKKLAGRSLIGPLNGLLRQAQLKDKISEEGRRNVCVSRFGDCLEGFELSLITPFKNIIRKAIPVTINREKLSTIVQLPSIRSVKKLHPWWSLKIALILVPDVEFGKRQFEYTMDPLSATYNGPWQKAGHASKATKVRLELDLKPPVDSFLLLVAIGFAFGEKKGEEIADVHGEGAGKILKVLGA